MEKEKKKQGGEGEWPQLHIRRRTALMLFESGNVCMRVERKKAAGASFSPPP